MDIFDKLGKLAKEHIIVQNVHYRKQDMEKIRQDYPTGKNNLTASVVFENGAKYLLNVCILDEEKKYDSFSFASFCCTCCNRAGIYDNNIYTLKYHLYDCSDFFKKISLDDLDVLDEIIKNHSSLFNHYKAIKWVDSATRHLQLLNKAKEAKYQLVEEFEKSQLSNFTESVSSLAVIEKVKSASGKAVESTIDEKEYSDTNNLCDVFLKISSVVSDSKEFPPLPGIYLLRCFTDGEWQPLYLGLSNNIRNRWKHHHRQGEVNLLTRLGIKIEYRYIVDSPLTKLSEPLEIMEAKLIKAFNPRLNREYVEV